jgi:uncharacterized protein (TIGR00299 family) protein
MILASMIDSGLSIAYLKKELSKLKMKGYSLKSADVVRNGIRASHFEVMISDHKTERTIDDIKSLIKNSRLKPAIKEMSLKIFSKLFDAESKVHGRHIRHLHELGAVDAIVDIIGAAIGLDKLGIKEVYCSPLPFGYGPIKCAHGILPNPAPATAELLKGVPIYKKNIKGELVTPTGAAIITTITKDFKDMPKMELKTKGLGAGTFQLNEPNILRLFVGEADDAFKDDLVAQIETNIDNMNPEFYDHIINNLMKLGALDASLSVIQMKKNRPGVKLTVLADIEKKDKLINAIFSETTTLGVRTYLVKRVKLERTIKKVKTRYGSLRVKIGNAGQRIMNISPEYRDCVSLSKKTGLPLKVIYDEAKKAASHLQRTAD